MFSQNKCIYLNNVIKGFHDKALRGFLRETCLRKEKKKCVKNLYHIYYRVVSKKIKVCALYCFSFFKETPLWQSNFIFKNTQIWFYRFFFLNALYTLDEVFPRGLFHKESICHRRRHGFSPWIGKIPWRWEWQPTPVVLPGESHGQRSLGGLQCVCRGPGVGWKRISRHETE